MSKHTANTAAEKIDNYCIVIGDQERVIKAVLAVAKSLVHSLEDSMPTDEATDVAADFLTRLTKTVIQKDSYPALVQLEVLHPNRDNEVTLGHIQLLAHQISITTEVYEMFQAEKIGEAMAMIEADLARS